MPSEDESANPPRITFGEALRIRPLAVLYTAETQSSVGDQLARLALSVLVFERTHSAAATAVTFALTFLPAIAGGLVLGRLGDTLSRRTVMISADTARAVLFVMMAVPGMPLPAVFALLIVAVFIGPAFVAAEVSFLASALDGEEFRTATALRMASGQGVQVLGFGLGGLVLTWIDPHIALAIDAGTFVASAVLIVLGLRGVVDEPRARPRPVSRASAFAALVRDPYRITLVALSCLAGFFVAPEGLAVPVAHHSGAANTGAGVLLASIPLGGVLGAWILPRIPERRRRTVSYWMVCGCGVPLIATPLISDLRAIAACWLLSGLLAAYQVEITAELVRSIPDVVRARSLGVVSACLTGAQGMGVALFGFLAPAVGAGSSVAIAGALGAVSAVALVRGSTRRAGDVTATSGT